MDYLYLRIDADLPDTVTASDLCTVGPIATSGNLPLHQRFGGGLAGDIYYQYTEVDASLDTVNFVNVLESDPSPISTPAIQPNGVKNQSQLTLASPVNPTTTHYYLYRGGGNLLDGQLRLIARLDVSADQSADASHLYTWNHGTRVFVDNIPDSSLLSTLPTFLLTGREAAPTGATCIAEWQERIWVARGAQVNGSWALAGDLQSGLYFNSINVPDPNDTAQAIKGAQFAVGGDDDVIMALIPLGPYLAVVKRGSTHLIVGEDGTSFASAPHLQRSGIGLLAGLGWDVYANRAWMLAADGLRAYDAGAVTDPVALDIEPAVNPLSRSETPLQPAAYAQSWGRWHGARFYLGVPDTSDSTEPDCCYVYDARTGGWVGKWTDWHMTSCATLSAAVNNADVYFGGADGQIYQLTGDGDLDVSGGTVQPVDWAFGSKGFTCGDRWSDSTASVVRVRLRTGESTTVRIEVSAPDVSDTWSVDRVIDGDVNYRSDLGNGVSGKYLSVAVSGSTITTTKIELVGLEIATGDGGSA